MKMKKVFFAALATVIGFSMAACDTGSNDVRIDLPPAGDGSITFAPGDPPMTFPVVDRYGDPVALGGTMNFTRMWGGEDNGDYWADMSDIIPNSVVSLSADGVLSLILGTPTELWPLVDLFENGVPRGISITAGLRVFIIENFSSTDDYFLVWRTLPDQYNWGGVDFFYADRAGTVMGIIEDEYVISRVNMELSPGWNTVIATEEWNPVSGREYHTMVTGRPGDNFKWILRDY
ncbi:MAG: hypothetical protein FWC64_08165 [Treponema sp.]|nr:hypothetical protein [Treponema sp.]